MATSHPDAQTSYVNWFGVLVTDGTPLYATEWGHREGDVNSHFLWHVERTKADKLVVVADGYPKRRLPLTQARAVRLNPYTPAPGPTLLDFPEEWSWWRSFGWGLVLRETLQMPYEDEPSIELQAYRAGRVTGMSWDGPSWRLVQQHPHALRRQLGEILYFVVHPRKARALGIELCAEKIPNEVYRPFVEQMRRRAKRLGYA